MNTEIWVQIIEVAGLIAVAVVEAISSRKTRKEVKTVGSSVDAISEAQRDLMRNEITKLYYKRQNVEELNQYERESLDKLYAGYTAMGGNSFVHDIYEEMRSWKVVRK